MSKTATEELAAEIKALREEVRLLREAQAAHICQHVYYPQPYYYPAPYAPYVPYIVTNDSVWQQTNVCAGAAEVPQMVTFNWSN